MVALMYSIGNVCTCVKGLSESGFTGLWDVRDRLVGVGALSTKGTKDTKGLVLSESGFAGLWDVRDGLVWGMGDGRWSYLLEMTEAL